MYIKTNMIILMLIIVNSHTKVSIVCPKHGEFLQLPNDHLNGSGCPKCSNEIKGKYQIGNIKDFINKSKSIHNNKYNYSEFKYVNNRTKSTIICPKHGKFLQTPHNHLSGYGCPICNQSKLENEIMGLLKENNIEFIQQYRPKWLNGQSLDFYLPNNNIAIECQGIQHFRPIEFFGGETEYKNQVNRDLTKKRICDMKNVKILYYSKINENDTINSKKDLLLKII